MAGGVAGKAHPLYVTALAKLADATKEIQFLSQHGAPAVHSKQTQCDTSITAAITALQALT